MNIGNILAYGIYDSKKQFANTKKSPPRKVSNFEFDYILDCDIDATAQINNTSFLLRPQTLVFRKPGQTSFSTLNFRCYCLHLSIPDDSCFYDELVCLPNFYNIINGSAYKMVFEQLFSHIADKGTACDYFVCAKLLELFYLLINDAKFCQNHNSSTFSKDCEGINKAIDFMKNNFGLKITLDDLGKIAGYSPNYFQKIFSQFLQVSPQKYLENLRISHAKIALCEQDKSIIEIAYECGFSSQSHFASAFKKSTGLTPYKYRLSSIVKI